MSNVLIIGYHGFLGSKLKDFHIKMGDFVYGISNQYNPNDDTENFKAINFDIINFTGSIECIVRKIDYIYDFAWVGSSSINDRMNIELQFGNINITCNCIELAERIECKRIIFASSICEMEVLDDLFFNEHPYIHGGQLYGITKLTAKMYCQVLSHQKNIEFIPVIISNVFGDGEISPRLINTTIRKILNHEHLSFSEGNQMYDFIYINDAVKKIYLVATKGKKYEQYYIGSEIQRPLKDFLKELINIVDKNADYAFGEIRSTTNGIDYKKINILKIKNEIGFCNEFSFEEGIKLTTDWIKMDIQKDCYKGTGEKE